MAEVKWIKITTGMFEDEKIDFIESLPEADAILIIWIKLLTLAGKCNANGFIFLTEKIPYTTEMLAHKFRRPINVIKLALETLKNLDMIQLNEDGFLAITNWEKHQNIEGLDKIREQTRKRVARYRARQKELPSSNVTGNVTVTEGNATDIDIDIDIEEELDIDIDIEEQVSKVTTLKKENIELIIKEWNKLNLQQLRSINSNTNRYSMLRARVNEYSFEDVISAIRNIEKSSFLKGQNDRGWVITFDWFIRPNNFLKVLEGNYIDKNPKIKNAPPKNSKKTRFHTNESRTENYSADELEKAAERKRREYIERMKKGD